MTERLEVQITADARQLTNTLKKAGSSVDDFGKKAEQAGGGAGKFRQGIRGLSQAASAVGLAGLVTTVGSFIVSANKAADEARVASSAFRNLSGGAAAAKDNFDAVTKAVTVSGRVLVDETSRMQIANQLLGMGIANTAGELEEVVGVSRRLGAAFRGMGAADAANEFAIMMSNMSVQRLDSFGIASGKVRERINELMETTAGMTREQAFFQATMEEARVTLNRLGPEVETQGQSVQAAQSAWADFTGAFGTMLQSVGDSTGTFDAATGAINRLTEGAEAWTKVFTETLPALREYNAEHNLYVTTASGRVVPATEEMMEAQRKNTAETKLAIETTSLLSSSVDFLASKTDEMENVQRGANASALRYQEMGEANIQVLEDLAGGHLATKEEVEAYTEAQELAAEAERRRVEQISTTKVVMADFFLSMSEAEQNAADSSAEAASRLAQISQETNVKLIEAGENLNEKLEEIEKKRQEKIHKVLEGGHARTQQENDEALAHWDNHFNELVAKTEAKYAEQTAKVESELEKQRAAIAAKQQAEREQQAQHLEDLKLQAALTTLETAGELEQFTGGLAVSSNEAFELIRAGVLPVSDELALAVQGTMQTLKEASDDATETAESNQDKLRQAFEGTLPKIEDFDERLRDLPSAADEAMAGIEPFGSGTQQVMQETLESVEKMTEAFKEEDWPSLGKAIVEGIDKGIEKNEKKILDRLKGLAKKALRSAQRELGIESPSQVFADQVGRPIVEGLVSGVNIESPNFQAALVELVSANKVMRAGGMARTRAKDLGRLVGAEMSRNIGLISSGNFTGQDAFGLAADRARQLNFPPSLLSDYVDFGQAVKFIDEQFQALSKQRALANLENAVKDSSLFTSLGRTAATRVKDEVKGRLDVIEARERELDMIDQENLTAIGRLKIEQERAELEEKKLGILEEMEEAEGRIAAIRQQQQDLQFLQQQIQLVDMLREQGLDAAEVLGEDFEFGMDIDPAALAEATSRALNAIIGRVNEGLREAQGLPPLPETQEPEPTRPGRIGGAVIPGIFDPTPAVGGLVGGLPGQMPAFQQGGNFVVPGAPGMPFPIMVHGGERVTVDPTGGSGGATEYHLHVSSPIPSAGLIQDFRMLQAQARS